MKIKHFIVVILFLLKNALLKIKITLLNYNNNKIKIVYVYLLL